MPAPATARTSPSSCRCSSAARLIAFAATTAHHLDIGALSPGSCGIVEAIDAYAEGLQFKAIKVYDRGVKNEMVWQIVRDNIRASDLVVGDMDAQIAAARIGAERMVELVERYGLETFELACEALMDHAERLMRQAIARLPDGVYRAETAIDGYLDSDDPGKKELPIVVTITKKDDEPGRRPDRHRAAGARPADQHAARRHRRHRDLAHHPLGAARHRTSTAISR